MASVSKYEKKSVRHLQCPLKNELDPRTPNTETGSRNAINRLESSLIKLPLAAVFDFFRALFFALRANELNP